MHVYELRFVRIYCLLRKHCGARRSRMKQHDFSNIKSSIVGASFALHSTVSRRLNSRQLAKQRHSLSWAKILLFVAVPKRSATDDVRVDDLHYVPLMIACQQLHPFDISGAVSITHSRLAAGRWRCRRARRHPTRLCASTFATEEAEWITLALCHRLLSFKTEIQRQFLIALFALTPSPQFQPRATGKVSDFRKTCLKIAYQKRTVGYTSHI